MCVTRSFLCVRVSLFSSHYQWTQQKIGLAMAAVREGDDDDHQGNVEKLFPEERKKGHVDYDGEQLRPMTSQQPRHGMCRPSRTYL